VKSPDHGYECSLCAAVLAIPPNKEPIIMFIGRHTRGKVRAITVDGLEIHRCEVRISARDS
jgi:hypothetical protein